jgi:hypothetical protein
MSDRRASLRRGGEDARTGQAGAWPIPTHRALARKVGTGFRIRLRDNRYLHKGPSPLIAHETGCLPISQRGANLLFPAPECALRNRGTILASKRGFVD